MMVAALLLAFGLLAVVTLMVWRGDGRTDLRRCPGCWYDMSSATALTCPECGHVVRDVSELRRPRRVATVWMRAVYLAWALLLLIAYFSLPGPWTGKVPRPLLALALAFAAPGPSAAGAGQGLPTPNAALKNSASPWERLVWDYQASIALEAWADSVLANKGPITADELARLVPLANQAHDIYRQFGSTIHNEGFRLAAFQLRLAKARDASSEDPNISLRYEWVLSEMQFEGGDYSHRPDFAWEPDAIILQALSHPDPTVRLFGVDRFARRVHRVVVAPTSPMPPGRRLIEAIAESDADDTVRQRARTVREYTDGFLPGT